ncbi:MAG: aromatic amino acid lyase, partial [bacterium]|nr:aromatic amino acid lyase [bacterium]
QEDHVSMGFNAARHARQIVRNVEYVLGIEAICGARGLDFRLRDGEGEPGSGTRAVYDAIRERIPAPEGDVYLSPMLEQARELVNDGIMTRAAEEAVGGLL